MLTIRTTNAFDTWFSRLRDKTAQRRIQVRIDRLQLGHPGDVKPVRAGVSELRINHGPGYPVYFVQRGAVLIILLCGGDKSTQEADIRRAIELSRHLDVE